MADINNLKEEKFVFGHGFTGFSPWSAAFKAETSLVEEHGGGELSNSWQVQIIEGVCKRKGLETRFARLPRHPDTEKCVFLISRYLSYQPSCK